MNNLKLLGNVLKNSNSTLIRCPQVLKQRELCLKNEAASYYSTAVFIRNTGGLAHPVAIYKERSELHRFLSTKLQTHAYAPAPIYNTQCQFSTKITPDRAIKSDSKSAAITEIDLFGEDSKLGLFAKFKLMYKKYWYVLIPVHVVTSAGWMCGFYYMSKSGVDVPSLLQFLHLSETIIEKVQTSNLGHWAVAYLCYKVATPVRYAVTLGGSTISIKYLVQQGYIKPIPTKAELVRMYKNKKVYRAAMKSNTEKEQPHNQQPENQRSK